MLFQKLPGNVSSRAFGYRVRKYSSLGQAQICAGAMNAPASVDAVVAMPTSARAPSRLQEKSTSADASNPNPEVDSNHSSPIPAASVSGEFLRRPWSLANVKTDRNGRLLGWQTDWPGPDSYAAAGIVPFAYREDEGQLYVLLSIQRSDKGGKPALVYTFLGGKVAAMDRKDARRTAAREAHEETHRLLDKKRVLDVLVGAVPAYDMDLEKPGSAVAGQPNTVVAAATAAAAISISGEHATAAPAAPAASPSSVVTSANPSKDDDVTVAGGATAPAMDDGRPVLTPTTATTPHQAQGTESRSSLGPHVPSSSSGLATDSANGAGQNQCGGGGSTDGGGGFPVPSEYFWSGRYMTFAIHLPNTWKLPEGCAAKIKAKQKHREAEKAEGLEWVSLRQLGQLLEGQCLQDSVSGRSVRGHHYMVSLLRVKGNKVGVLTWLERLEKHIRSWHGLPDKKEEDMEDTEGLAAAEASGRRARRGSSGGKSRKGVETVAVSATEWDDAEWEEEEEEDGARRAGQDGEGGAAGEEEGPCEGRKGRRGPAAGGRGEVSGGKAGTPPSPGTSAGLVGLARDGTALPHGTDLAAEKGKAVASGKGQHGPRDVETGTSKGGYTAAAIPSRPPNQPAGGSGSLPPPSARPLAAGGTGDGGGSAPVGSSPRESAAEDLEAGLKLVDSHRHFYVKWGLDGACVRVPGGQKPPSTTLRLQPAATAAARFPGSPRPVTPTTTTLSLSSSPSSSAAAVAVAVAHVSGGVATTSRGAGGSEAAAAVPATASTTSQEPSRQSQRDGDGGTGRKDMPAEQAAPVKAAAPSKGGAEPQPQLQPQRQHQHQQRQLQPPQEQAKIVHEAAAEREPKSDSWQRSPSSGSGASQDYTSPSPPAFQTWRMDGSSDTGFLNNRPPPTMLRFAQPASAPSQQTPPRLFPQPSPPPPALTLAPPPRPVQRLQQQQLQQHRLQPQPQHMPTKQPHQQHQHQQRQRRDHQRHEQSHHYSGRPLHAERAAQGRREATESASAQGPSTPQASPLSSPAAASQPDLSAASASLTTAVAMAMAVAEAD